MSEERLQKFLSQAGVASRRSAEVLITSGRVVVNGRTITALGTKVDPSRDKVQVDGKLISAPEKLVYFAFYKPAGCVTTRKDTLNRKTVFSYLPKDLRQKVWNVGRLDYETEGLLLFSNDGELTHELTHPSFEHIKTYEAQLDKTLRSEDIARLEEGVDIGGFVTSPAKVKKLTDRVVSLTIHEGKNRQVRRMFASLNYEVKSLIRTEESGLKLDELGLKPGEIKEIERGDIIKG